MIADETYYLKKQHVNKHGTVYYTEIFKLTCIFESYTDESIIGSEIMTLDYVLTRKRCGDKKYKRTYKSYYSWYTTPSMINCKGSSLFQIYKILLPYKNKNNIRLTIVPYSEIEADVVLYNL